MRFPLRGGSLDSIVRTTYGTRGVGNTARDRESRSLRYFETGLRLVLSEEPQWARRRLGRST